jgi:hypothetical protein
MTMIPGVIIGLRKGVRQMAGRREATERYKVRRALRIVEAGKARLGGKCVECGTDRDLEFHHVARAEKRFCVSEGARTFAEARVVAEIGKCRLLCASCHAKLHNEARWLESGDGMTEDEYDSLFRGPRDFGGIDVV